MYFKTIHKNYSPPFESQPEMLNLFNSFKMGNQPSCKKESGFISFKSEGSAEGMKMSYNSDDLREFPENTGEDDVKGSDIIYVASTDVYKQNSETVLYQNKEYGDRRQRVQPHGDDRVIINCVGRIESDKRAHYTNYNNIKLYVQFQQV